jgi:hypothetical protein
MAVWEAYRKFLAKDCAGFTDDDAFIAVGDGATPRTAALFAFLTKAGTCFAVDPLLENARFSPAAAPATRGSEAPGSSGSSRPSTDPTGAPASSGPSPPGTSGVPDVARVKRQSDHNADFFSKLRTGIPATSSNTRTSAAAKGGVLEAHPWQDIRRLKVLPHRVERVRMRARRVVVLLLHCHCSLPQVMSAIECEELVGLITAPCCQVRSMYV